MKNMLKRFCLVVLAMSPVLSVAFAAQSALKVEQIRNGNATDSALQDGGVRSGVNKG